MMKAGKINKLFEPFSLKGVELKNRIVMPAIASNFNSEFGEVTETLINFLTERAKGGAGFIIVESSPVDRAGSSRYTSVMMDRDEFIPRLQQLTDSVHRFGAKIAIQLSHAGRFASIKATHVLGQSASGLGGSTLWDSSGGQDTVRQITQEDIHSIVKKFGEAGRRAKEAGFDAIEIHGAHGLLIHEFLSPLVNNRNDGYGGNLENRAKFAIEVLKAIRQRVGENFPVIYRISAEEGVEGGLEIEESKSICQMFEKAGASAIDVSAGTAVNNPLPKYPPFPSMAFPHGIFIPFAEAIKKSVNIPVIAVGRINHPLLAEKILEQGKADLIGLARALIADPEFSVKAKKYLFNDIRPCIGCGLCLDSLFQRRPLECLVNPSVGREKEFAIKKAENSKKIVVIGGGPAGLEASRVAALRGHQVVLYEKENRLGGQLNLAIRPPYRGEMRLILKYLVNQINTLGVKVHLGVDIHSDLIKKENPDEVIMATGAKPKTPNIPGVEKDMVVSAWDILSGNISRLGHKLIIIGGDRVGPETAEFLTKKGPYQITIIEQSANIAKSLEQNEKRYLLNRLTKQAVEILTNVRALEIGDGEVVVGTFGEKWSIKCDNVVLACGASPNRGFIQELKEIFPNFYLIGDALDPRSAKEAIYEGARIARLI